MSPLVYMIKSAVEVFPDQPLWQRPVSGLLGRLSSPLYAAALANEDFLKPGPTKEDVESVAKYYPNDEQDKKNDIELAMYPNAAHPIENLKRVWKRKGISIPSKVLGTVMSPLTDLMTSMNRGDHYNPFAHSITSYVNNPGVKFHEMGHAEDFSDKKWKTPWALARMLNIPLNPFTLYQEFKASDNAGPNIRKYIDSLPKKDRNFEENKANATLNAGLTSYIAGLAGPLGRAVAAPVTAGIGWGSRLAGMKNWSKDRGKGDKSDEETPNAALAH